MFTPFPDARYEIKSFAADPERNNVSAFAVFHAQPHRPRGPGTAQRQVAQDRLSHVMQFTGDKISHMTKIWNDGLALKQVGWGLRRALPARLTPPPTPRDRLRRAWSFAAPA